MSRSSTSGCSWAAGGRGRDRSGDAFEHEPGHGPGHPGYMSPSRRGARGRPPEDSFSAGVLLEMLTGRRAFKGRPGGHPERDPREDPTEGVAPALSCRRLLRVVRRWLEKAPERSLPVARDLAFAWKGPPVRRRKGCPTAPAPRRRWLGGRSSVDGGVAGLGCGRAATSCPAQAPCREVPVPDLPRRQRAGGRLRSAGDGSLQRDGEPAERDCSDRTTSGVATLASPTRRCWRCLRGRDGPPAAPDIVTGTVTRGPWRDPGGGGAPRVAET